MKPSFIVIHHSGDTIDKPRFDIINNYHMRRGFPQSRLGYFGGYHYLIDNDKETKRYRNDDEIGAHARQRLMNFRSIGICVAGNFSRQEPAQWQIRALQKLVQSLQLKHGIPIRNVLLHKELRATACPGVDWKKYLRVEAPVIRQRSRVKRLRENVLRRLKRRLKHFTS